MTDALDSVPGWFTPLDRVVFRWFLSEQVRHGERGDVAELGVYMGKSAILTGEYVQAGERFTVIDLFDSSTDDDDNERENAAQYPELTRRAFESYYRQFHPSLPKVVQDFSQNVTHHARHGTHRWVHVDASHLYEHVKADIAAARVLLGPHGLIACDDIRSKHAPGVAAAAWEAVANDGLKPLLITPMKLYATWSAADVWRERLASWLPASGLGWELQSVAGGPLYRVWAEGEVPAAASRPRLLKRLAPPVLWDVLSRARNRRAPR